MWDSRPRLSILYVAAGKGAHAGAPLQGASFFAARDHQCSQVIPSWHDWHSFSGSSSSGVAGRTSITLTT
jgi:hypothetical protein